MLHLAPKLFRAAAGLIIVSSVVCFGLPVTVAASEPIATPSTVAGSSTSVDAVTDPSGMPADADPGTVVAKVQSNPITLGELKKFAAERLQEQRTTYELRREQLDLDYRRAQQQVLEEELKRSLNQQVLSRESDSRKTNVLKLAGQVKIPAVTDDEVRARYESRKVDGAPPLERVAAEIRKGLEEERSGSAMETYYAGLRTKYAAVATLEPLRQAVGTDGPARGPMDAPITLVEFADFQCPFCRRMAPTLESVMKRYPNQVRLIFRHFPLTDIHPEALHASQAAVCAQRQGKFWEMHDAIFSDETPLAIGSLRAIAGRIGLDQDSFEKCVRDPDVNTPINSDVHAAEHLGVRATPTLFVNGRFLQGGVPQEMIIALIEDELKHTGSDAKTAAR